MTTTAIVLLILACYGAAMYLVSRKARQRTASFQDTIAAPRQTTLLILAGSAVGNQIGSGFVIGGAEYGAQMGLAGAWYGIGCGLTYFLVAAMSGFIYRRGMISLSDYFAQRYHCRAIQMIYSVSSILCSVALLAGQLLAGRSIFVTLGLPAAWSVAAIAVIALIYSNTAGLWGSMTVSSLQSAVILFGMLSAFAVAMVSLGPGTLTAALPPEQFDLTALDGELLVSMTAPIVLMGAVSQFSFQSVASARSLRTAQGGYLLAGLILIPTALIPPLLGMFGRSLFPDLPADQAFPSLLLTRLPTAVAAVILAAVLCAVLCSCNIAYLSTASIAIYSVYQGMFHPEADDGTCRRMMFVTNLAVGAAGICIALTMDDIIQVLSAGYSLIIDGCLVPFLGGVLWEKGSTRGALAASAVGMAACLADFFGLIALPWASLTCVALSILAFLVVSPLTPDRQGAR